MKKLAIALLLAGSAGCSFFSSFLWGAGDAASQRAGENAANSAMGPRQAPPPGGAYGGGAYGGGAGGGGMSMATMNPAFLNMYMGVIFTYAFSSGGYDVSQVDYKPGEYTRWTGKGRDGKAILIERAHLFDDQQGRQWWKVKFTDNDKTTILEGLLDPSTRTFVRMRAKFPDDKEGNEMPMTDDSYYRPAQKLSKDSVEGATKGVENVSVPAGAFSAKHVVFGGMDGSHEWWLDEKVPGGAVKQLLRNPKSDEDRWEMELAAYGSDARSELGTK